MIDSFPVAGAAQSRRAILWLLRDDRPRALGGLALVVAGLAASMLGPWVLGHIVDLVIAHSPISTIAWWCPVLLAVALVQGAFTATGSALVAAAGERIAALLRESVLGRALRLPQTDVEQAGRGDLLTRLNEDMSILSTAVGELVPTLLTAGLTILLTLGSLVLLDWRLALGALACLPLQAFAVRWLLRTALSVQRSMRQAASLRSQEFVESVDGADVARAFGITESRERRFAAHSRDSMRWSLRISLLSTKFFGKLNGGELLGLATVLVLSFVLVRADAITIGTASAAALYFHRLFDPFNTLLGQFHDAQGALVATGRIIGVAELPLPSAPVNPVHPRGSELTVRGVWHEYQPGRPVLHPVELTVRPGAKVALVGASGAGKTTLATIIAGVREPSGGTVSIGGVPLSELDSATLAHTVTLLSQEGHVFHGTLAEDLRLAAPGAEQSLLHKALDTVGALGWVRGLPSGLDTLVGEGGWQLTVTQAQQLALARLVLADPPVAVLDEATADAGSAGARELERAADAALPGRTSLVVAHRLTQAMTADEIVVLADGRIVEQGSHAELLERQGEYARLWAAWAAARATR
ncbi:MAG TPA: ABC transporter ATP-binding protein [Pseudonocardiaceae bacterium]|nr:ABC transporter ATP-binding protein [Pseudonocardiaceae bacterium]